MSLKDLKKKRKKLFVMTNKDEASMFCMWALDIYVHNIDNINTSRVTTMIKEKIFLFIHNLKVICKTIFVNKYQ